MILRAGPVSSPPQSPRSLLPFLALSFLALSVVCGILLILDGQPARADDASGKRYALVIANGNYPDANLPLPSAAKDGDAFAAELRRYGFDVDLKSDLTKDDMQSTVKAFLDKITPGSTALLYFNGIGIQVSHQTYLIPVNAELWSETDVKRDGVGIDNVLAEMNRRGARVKIAIIDAARRNPFERRFRAYSAGLAGIDAPEGTLVVYAAAPNKIAKDSGSNDVSLFMSELLKELRTPDISAEEAMTHTRVGVSRASNGEQVPWVASSLIDPFYFGGTSTQGAPSSAPPKPSAKPASPPSPAASPSPAPKEAQAAKPKPQEAQAPKPKPEAQPQSTPPAPSKPTAPTAKEPAPSQSASTEPDKPKPAPDKPTASPAKEPAPSQSAGTEPDKPKPSPAPAPAPVKPPPSSTQQAQSASPSPPAPTQSPSPPKDLKPGTVFQDCPDCPEMVVLPSGSFEMGTGKTPYDRPVHKVTITKPFAMGQSEVTFAEWNECAAQDGCKAHPDNQGWGGGDRPVINVSWFDATEYVAWLSKKTGKTYRLPSEAQWEYAARGGTTTPFWWGAAVGTNLANCADCGAGGTGKQTVPVKSFKANAFGLFDMSGNAAEWVEDCWNLSYKKAPSDGSAMLDGNCGQRGLRGGSFDSTSAYIKPTARFRYDADVRYWANGFRVVRDLP